MDSILRIIDANFNRAREGMRVIEDTLRFYYNMDVSSIRNIKELRHSLSIIIDRHFGLTEIKRGRDTINDKGKWIDTRSREDVKQVIERNFMRVSEALRVMEEYSRAIKPEVSSGFHKLRFKLYRIEKDVLLYISKKEIHLPFLSVLLEVGRKTPFKHIKMVVDSMPDVLILRPKGMDDGYFLKVARKARKIVPHNVRYLISGRPDICLICDADGVFLERKDIPCEEVKKVIQDKIILTDSIKIVNIPVKEIDITRARLKKLFTENMTGIIITAGEEIPKEIETIIKTLKKEVDSYGRRRKEKTARKE
ncbi:MAG: thiamine phosphate synthase [Candidatus Omnitrophica bacterium]|nr:thiamine phosphate synthase [Candidatus Omnitrophota bacterium]MCM8829975.1 thiamine phosphate synthase [Candidatus Omnitrophota bacterium]